MSLLGLPESAAAKSQVDVYSRPAYLQATYCVAPTVTPTAVNPTATPTGVWSSPTPKPAIVEDAFENNDSSGAATWVSVQATNSGLTFCHPSDPNDVDWFRFDVKAGKRYEIQTTVDIGLDTYMELFLDPSGTPLAVNDDKAVGDLGSKVGYTANSNATLYLRIVNRDPANPVNKDYSLSIVETAPEALIPGTADSFEPNYDFVHAALIGSGDSLAANFVPWPGGDLNAPDNDYYRIYVKAGLSVTCETSNLGPSADTNMVMYDAAGNVLGGNDDIALGNYASRVTGRPGATGDVYVLVGQAHAVGQAETPNLTYDMICNIASPIPPTSTPAPPLNIIPVQPTLTQPATPTPTRTPTFFGVFAVSTPVRPTQNVPAVADFDVQVFYDANGNHAADADEGIQGMIVELRDRALGVLLARTVTDELGRVRLTGTAFGEFDLRVPYFGLRRALRASEQNVSIEIRGSALPLLIP